MVDEIVAGRYRLDERTDGHGEADVWTAYDLELDRPVTLVVLGEGGDRDRFERELRAGAALSHPNIRQLYDSGEIHGRPYVVLEHLDGGSLGDRLAAGGPCPAAESERIAREFAAALAYAHGRGIVHGAITPERIRFDSEGTTKLTGFGLAREEATPAVDVRAFGAIVYGMLTGRLPETDAPSVPDDAPDDLAALAVAALAGEPADGSALVRALEPEPLPPAPPATEEDTAVLRPARGFPSRPVVAGAGFAALALAGAGLAVLLNPSSSPAPITSSSAPSRSTTRSTVTTTTPSTTATTQPTTSKAATRSTPSTRSTVPVVPPSTPPPPPPPPTTEPTTTAATTTDATTVGTTTGP